MLSNFRNQFACLETGKRPPPLCRLWGRVIPPIVGEALWTMFG
jgi:hypothetical protein